jgi:predicted amidohydrolase YtcJ
MLRLKNGSFASQMLPGLLNDPAQIPGPLRVLFCFGVLLHATIGACAAPADLVFVNGAVYTVDAARSWATAVAVTGERIVYVGDDATARSFAGPATRVIDLAHRMLMPGFQDSHVHPADVYSGDMLDLHGLMQRDALFERIGQYARTHPEKAWIVGDGWDETAFLNGGQPTRQMLDALVPDRPAFLYDNAGDAGWVNSRALAAARVTAATVDPPNGRIERDASGQPTGLLQELAAMALVEAAIPPPSPQEQVDRLAGSLQQMKQLGITALEDPWAKAEWARAYKTLDERGALELRTNLCLPFAPELDDEAQFQSFVAQRSMLAGHRLRADCVKFFLDGAYGSHTVVLLQPYSDEPGKFGSGRLFVEPERLKRMVVRLDAAGFQVHVHAQGDGAVRAALDAFAAARQTNGPRDNRHTIAHLCLIDPADIPRFRALGVIANMSPLWSVGDTWETVMAPRLFGPERSRRLLQMRTLLDAGAMLVWGSDWPVTGVSPLEAIETATTHRYPGGRDPAGREDRAFNPQERVSLEQAIVAYTATGAYLLHDEQARGSLTAGKLADMVVLHNNLFDAAPLAIHRVQVDMTIVGGQVVFARKAD